MTDVILPTSYRTNAPRWKFYIARSGDLSRVAEVTKIAKSKQLQLGLNQSGKFSFSVATTHDVMQYLTPVKYCLICQRNDETVWSGPIWTRNENFTAQNVTVDCVGWLDILYKRFHIASDITYTNVNAGTIIYNILALANAQHNTWITQGTNTNTQERSVTLTRLSNYGEQIKSLTQIENGCDIEIDPVTRELNIYAADDFNETNAVFGFNTGRKNVKDFERSINADTMANQYYGQGQYAIGEAHDDDSIGYIGQVLQQVLSVTDVINLDLLGAIINAELAVNAYPRVIYSFTPLIKNTDVGPNFFDHYNIRDQVKISAKRDYLEPVEDLAVRVFAASIDIDDLGNEVISGLQTTYQSG